MPRNAKPRKPYRPRASLYPDLHDVGMIFRPIHRLFDQLREGEVDSAQGRPIFLDWTGTWCDVVPALDGWVGCWKRITAGEGVEVDLSAVSKLARYLDNGVPLTEDMVDQAWQQIMVTQRLTMKITRKALGDYMRTEQIAIELEQLGVANAA